ncbi:MAG: hypothetical protein ACKOPT_02545, partial [Cyanobium sp.]
MTDRLITPSQLALFSRSPVIGAWWEELDTQKLVQEQRPVVTSLDQLLFESGLEHERVLIERLEAQNHSVARLRGKQAQEDYDATIAAMHEGADTIWQASLRNHELRGSADLLQRINKPSALGEWSYIPIECKLSSHPKPVYVVQACVLRVNPVGRRFASIKCYLFCLSPGNTGIRPSSDLASSVRLAVAEFARTTSHRVAQGYRTTTGIDPAPGGSPGPRGPCRVRPHWAGPASDPARGPAASTPRHHRDRGTGITGFPCVGMALSGDSENWSGQLHCRRTSLI